MGAKTVVAFLFGCCIGMICVRFAEQKDWLHLIVTVIAFALWVVYGYACE